MRAVRPGLSLVRAINPLITAAGVPMYFFLSSRTGIRTRGKKVGWEVGSIRVLPDPSIFARWVMVWGGRPQSRFAKDRR